MISIMLPFQGKPLLIAIIHVYVRKTRLANGFNSLANRQPGLNLSTRVLAVSPEFDP